MDCFEFREFAIERDLAPAHKLRNDYVLGRPSSKAQMREHIERAPSTIKVPRFMQSRDGVDTGYLIMVQMLQEQVVYSHPYVSELEAFKSMLDYSEQRFLETPFDRYQLWIAGRFEDHLAVTSDRGYTVAQRTPESFIELTQAPDIDHDLIKRLKNEGYEFLNLPELAERFPDTWQHIAWRTEMDLMRDVPLPYEFEETPLEDFMNLFDDPTQDRSCLFYALKDGEVAGHSGLHPSQEDSKTSGTGLTGVYKSHRRKGLATVLKLLGFEWARSKGIERIYTDNEEGNPMYALNLALGFKKSYDWYCVEKQRAEFA